MGMTGWTAGLFFLNKESLWLVGFTRQLQDKGWGIDELRVDSGRLDDVFRDLTIEGGR
ncbi:MAG: hypothetical protein CM1200mP4_5550 [Rhodospirillaceae bacterium]|nr:MAG: hypothetical protein CM1200mP4_5550 [Rhodospirillaceae bacterium]